MAQRIQAVTAYRPRIDQGKAATEERFMELVTQRTTLSSGVVKNVQDSEVEALIGLLLDGRPVHTGSAIYTLSIGLDGKYEVNVRADKRIERAVNQEGAFRGEIINAENIGKTSDDLVGQWNVDHPDDPVEN
jgi:hypothetical protein